MPRTAGLHGKKLKRSFTLSLSAVTVLDELCQEQPSQSASALLEALILDAQAERRRRHLENKIAAYYDSLPEEEANEHKAWGDFAFAEALPSPTDAQP